MKTTTRFYFSALVFVIVMGGWSATDTLAAPPSAEFAAIGSSGHFRAFGISANGQYVVGWRDSGSTREAFRWDEESGVRLLGDFPGGRVWSEATAVSNSGIVVGHGEVNAAGGTNPFRWDPVSGLVNLGTLGGSVQGFANDISADGEVIAGMSRNTLDQQVAFRWTAASGMVELGMFGGSNSSYAHGISHDGNVIVGSGASGTEGWYWTQSAGFQGVGRFAPSSVSIARAASSDGSFIVGEASMPGVPNRLAFVWNGPDTMASLGDIPNETIASVAYDVSGDGRVIVGRSDTDIAVIWLRTAAGYQIHDLKEFLQDRHGLDLAGWRLQQASSVSEDGRRIAGYGISPAGVTRAWRVTIPVPEPSTWAMCILGGAMLGFRRRRRVSRGSGSSGSLG